MNINLEILLSIILVAIIVQQSVNALKKIIIAICLSKGIENEKTIAIISPFLSFLFSIILCVLINGDIFLAFNYTLSVQYVGSIFTGLLASGGANMIYKVVTDMQDYRKKLAIEETSNPTQNLSNTELIGFDLNSEV